MVLLINGNELNVSNVYEERDTATNTLYLVVDVPYGEAEYGALKAIFKTNTEDIVKVDNLGETRVYEGFVYASITDMEEDEVYRVKLIGNENTYQITRNRELEAKVAAKDGEILKLNNTIAEKDTVISEQAVDLVNLNEEMLVMAEEYVDLMYELATLKSEMESKAAEEADAESEVM